MLKFSSRTAVLLMLSALFIIGCGPQPATETAGKQADSSRAPQVAPKLTWEAKWESTLAAAKKEGKVTIVTFAGPETRTALTEAFKSKFGIDLEFIVGRAAENIPKIEAERNAGLYLADLFIDGSSTMVQLNNKGFLLPIEPTLILPEVADPKMWLRDDILYFSKNRTGIGFLSQYNSCVLRNTDLVKEGEISSYLDLLKPQWKDKIVMDDPSVGGSGAMFLATLSFGVWNPEEAGKWLRQMVKEQNAMLVRDPKLQVEWVARAKYPVSLAVWTDQLIKFLSIGAPIAQQRVKEGGFVTSSNGGIALLSKPAHPNGAIVFTNWLLSREGQELFTSTFGGPSRRKDVKAEGVYAALTYPPGDKAYEERSEEDITKKVELTKVSAQNIAEARR